MYRLSFFLALLLTSCVGPQVSREATGHQVDRSRPQLAEDQMMVVTAYLDLVVLQVDTTLRQLQRLTDNLEGYATELGTQAAVLRIPTPQLEEAVGQIEALGDLRRQRIQRLDVTEQYTDLGIRLDNARNARSRYLELLQQAENVEAALQVERELQRLNETIDLLEGQQQRLEQDAVYATVRIDIREKKKPGLLGYIGLGLYTSVRWLFVRN